MISVEFAHRTWKSFGWKEEEEKWGKNVGTK
jgi:hypothetical protein